MISSTPIDVSRTMRLATLLLAVAAAAVVYVVDEPRVGALQERIDDAATALRSEEIAANEASRLRDERDVLASRYAPLFAQNAEALFLHDVLTLTRARHVRILATSLGASEPERTSDGGHVPFVKTHGTLELRGGYRNLLQVVAELSTGFAIVAVETPAFRRDGEAVVATIPVTILAPAHADSRPARGSIK